MPLLNREEKEEFLRLSGSLQLKKDFKAIEKNRKINSLNRVKIDLDDYINFLNIANAFINHKPRPFRKILGDNFKL